MEKIKMTTPLVEMDGDEMTRYLSRSTAACPFFEPGDEYKIVQKQNRWD